MPDQFIGLAEETGDIVPIGRWVLRESIRHCMEWRRLTPETDLRVAINLPGWELLDDALEHDINEVLATSGLPPDGLILEISEYLLERDAQRIAPMLARLRGQGVGLAIDDFGTGYPSLGSLRDIPVDIMKIDRSLLENAAGDRIGTAVLAAAVDVGAALDTEVVAEGVETRHQMRLLREMDCRVGQGFLFSRPLDPPALAELLRQGSKPWEALWAHHPPEVPSSPYDATAPEGVLQPGLATPAS